MKRIASLALALLMMATLLVGCGGRADTEKPADDDTAAPAEDGAYTGNWIVAVNTSEGDILYEAVAKFCDLVEEYSNGSITCDLYGGTQLGSGQELLEGMSYGVANVYAESIGTLAPFSDYANIDAVPYLYSGYDHFIKTWNSDLGKEMRTTIGEDAGFKILGGMYRGARITTAKKEMKTVDDFKGFKLRAPGIDVYVKTWEWLGATPTPLAITETYTAIQQGTVDGQENPISECWNYGFYEVCPYWIKTNHVYSQDCFFMDLNFFNELPAEAQEIAERAAKEASEWRNGQMVEREAEVEQKAIDAGVTIVDVDTKEFMDKFDGFVDEVFPNLVEWADGIRAMA
ncbi:tripartite ATP-independent transporter solute receptor, DctP family [Oscillibacter sp. PC13]|uniref:TRAP transporter substrate-binding protein n=1 Tax=Oscillibacter sp. PC13 TaxID=1855299 RepID=UPI0008E5B4E9|nr:TRAP transporter substrate-binding protein [Oscillibacter sp. PC13]SFP03783.1 tripartite ATP-independent transporter solute receptor, DctP family [Oscillibacter sp. PC13]